MKSIAIVACLVIGCSSPGTGNPEPPCAPNGSYSVTYTPNRDLPGTCVGASFPAETVTVTTRDRDATIAFQGSTGPGCKGSFYEDKCQVVVKCDGDDGKGGTSTFQGDWIFNSRGFTGSSDYAFRPVGQPPCTANQAAHGTRK